MLRGWYYVLNLFYFHEMIDEVLKLTDVGSLIPMVEIQSDFLVFGTGAYY